MTSLPDASPLTRAAHAAGFTLDEAQSRAARHLEELLRVMAARRRRPGSGAYLWGPVGRGKTWLLDRFHTAATVPKRRFHFHDFYRALHAEVHAHRGRPDAVDTAVDALVGDARLVCFDELHLHDVGDAMLLTRALRRLVARRVTLVATSNYPPAGLLPNPLFHHLAEPLIGLLEAELEVLEVAGPVDYRSVDRDPTDVGFRAGRIAVGTTAQLAAAGVSRPAPSDRTTIAVGPVHVPVLRAREGEIWFDFQALCGAPVSASGMVSIAERHDHVVVVDVAPLADCAVDVQQRFVNLVDVLHDRDVALTLTAAVPLDVLLDGVWLPDVARTASRLQQLTSGGTAARASATSGS